LPRLFHFSVHIEKRTGCIDVYRARDKGEHVKILVRLYLMLQ
jgi:hypothetical protein